MGHSRNWILGSLKKDLVAFYVPGALTILITVLIKFPQNSIRFMVFAWISLALFDSGHVYTTIWRTYFNPEEFKRRRAYYVQVPVLIFCFFFFWMYFQIPYLKVFIAYFTIYHNVRQFYGVTKWYQNINQSWDKISDVFFYTLCLLPFLTMHFRTDLVWINHYVEAGVFMHPSLILEKLFTIAYFLVFGAWTLYEFFKEKRIGYWQHARILATLFPILTYTYCFMYAKDITGVLFPLVVSHGLTYFVLVGVSIKRIKLMKAQLLIFLSVVLTATVLGGLEFYIEDEFSNLYSTSLIETGLAALFLTPLFCHYIYDAFLWKGNHPEMKQILKPEAV